MQDELNQSILELSRQMRASLETLSANRERELLLIGIALGVASRYETVDVGDIANHDDIQTVLNAIKEKNREVVQSWLRLRGVTCDQKSLAESIVRSCEEKRKATRFMEIRDRIASVKNSGELQSLVVELQSVLPEQI